MFNQTCVTISQQRLDRCMSVKELLEAQDELNKNLPAGEGWNYFYSIDHMTTALLAEMGEILTDTGIQWKHWKYGTTTSTFSSDMLKLEVSDVVHFWLSIAIMRLRGDLTQNMNFNGSPDDEFYMYEKVYVGDQGRMTGVGLYDYPDQLNHKNFVHLMRLMTCGQRDMDAYNWVNTLGVLSAGAGMGCEELSAYMAAKTVLNKVRWLHPDWVKIDDAGREDNERLIDVVNVHLDDEASTLDTLRTAVLTEFYGETSL